MENRVPPIGSMLQGFMVILRGDVQRFFRSVDPAMSVRQFAKQANLTETPVRGIEGDEWPASDRTIRSLERAWCTHDAWQPKKTLDWRISGNDEGYILRRVVDPWTSEEFNNIAQRWKERSSDEVFVEELLPEDTVSVIDVTADDPLDYKIEKHASAVMGHTGINKTGILLRQNRTPLYRMAVCEDYTACLEAGEPKAYDVFWQVKRFNDGSFYRRLLLPCGHKLISISLIQSWRFPAGWH